MWKWTFSHRRFPILLNNMSLCEENIFLFRSKLTEGQIGRLLNRMKCLVPFKDWVVWMIRWCGWRTTSSVQRITKCSAFPGHFFWRQCNFGYFLTDRKYQSNSRSITPIYKYQNKYLQPIRNTYHMSVYLPEIKCGCHIPEKFQSLQTCTNWQTEVKYLISMPKAFKRAIAHIWK